MSLHMDGKNAMKKSVVIPFSDCQSKMHGILQTAIQNICMSRVPDSLMHPPTLPLLYTEVIDSLLAHQNTPHKTFVCTVHDGGFLMQLSLQESREPVYMLSYEFVFNSEKVAEDVSKKRKLQFMHDTDAQ